jgi:hypothetical protein
LLRFPRRLLMVDRLKTTFAWWWVVVIQVRVGLVDL